MVEIDLNPFRKNSELTSWAQDESLRDWMNERHLSFSNAETWRAYQQAFNHMGEKLQGGWPPCEAVMSGGLLDHELFQQKVANPIYEFWGKKVQPMSKYSITMGEKLRAWEANHDSDTVDCQVPAMMVCAWAENNKVYRNVMLSPTSIHPYVYLQRREQDKPFDERAVIRVHFNGQGVFTKELRNKWDAEDARASARIKMAWGDFERPITTMRFLDYLTVQWALGCEADKMPKTEYVHLIQALESGFLDDFKAEANWLSAYWFSHQRQSEAKTVGGIVRRP